MLSVDTVLVGKVSRPVSPKTIPSRSRSEDTTNKEGRPKTRPRPSVTTMSPTTPRSPTQHQPASPSSTYIQAVQSLDPRPLEELYSERSYFLYELQKQGDRATRLFHRYAAVEARLAAAQTASEIKKCKREAALVKTKIAESTQQEQLTLLRLGELQVELQNRGRWMMVHHQPVLSLPPLVYPPPPPPPSATMVAVPAPGMVEQAWCSMSPGQEQEDSSNTSATEHSSECSLSYGRSPSVLSPLSPCFTPGVVFAEDIWSRASKTSAERDETNEEEGSAPRESVGEGDEAGQEGHYKSQQQEEGKGEDGSCSGFDQTVAAAATTHHQERLEDCTSTPTAANHYHPSTNLCDSEQEADAAREEDTPEDNEDGQEHEAWRSKLRHISLYLPLSSPLRARDSDKRMSLPYLKGLWLSSSSSS